MPECGTKAAHTGEQMMNFTKYMYKIMLADEQTNQTTTGIAVVDLLLFEFVNSATNDLICPA